MSSDDTAGQGLAAPAIHRRGGLAVRAAKIVVIVVTAVFGLSASGLYLASEHLAGQVQRYPDVFAGLDDQTARPAPTPALTFLLVGSDSLAPEPTTGSDATAQEVPGGQRSDVIMMVHINADHTSASVVSLPRDSWVNVPSRGMHKINASYSLGGPALLVQTVEALTRIRVDHFAAIDLAGFQALTDAVGGIDVAVARPTMMGAVSFEAGQNHLDGRQALAYVRQRKGLPGGDLDRVRRHQNALRALLAKAASGGTLASPVQAYKFLDALTHWISVDDSLTNDDLRSLVWGLRDLRPGNVTFLTAPVAGLGREGTQSVVYLDNDRGSQLWRAVNAGDAESYVRQYPGSALEESTP